MTMSDLARSISAVKLEIVMKTR